MAKEEQEIKVISGNYPFARVGDELAHVLKLEADYDHFIAYAKELKKANSKASS